MKKYFYLIALSLSVLINSLAKADFWGGDDVILAQILQEAIQQYTQLQSILGTSTANLDLLKDINRGINDSLNMMRTLDPNYNPGLYADWSHPLDALEKLKSLYGAVVPSPDAQVQTDTDTNVAEAISLNNSLYGYTQQIDEIGEQVKKYSHDVSPGGAQKLTAQTLGVMLHVMNQSLRAQATELKLSAQTLALQNKKDKNATKQFLANSEVLKASMKKDKFNFMLPRF